MWGEAAIIAVVAVILAAGGASAYLPAAVCAVVGLHFIPLAAVLHDRPLVPLGAAVMLIALIALVVGLSTHVAASTVTGFGAGGALVCYAAWSLIRARGIRSARTVSAR